MAGMPCTCMRKLVRVMKIKGLQVLVISIFSTIALIYVLCGLVFYNVHSMVDTMTVCLLAMSAQVPTFTTHQVRSSS